MNSKIPFIAVVFLLIVTLFFIQKSQTTIIDSNKIIEDVSQLIEKVDKKLDGSSSPNSDLDPSEKDKFTAVEANISTEISQGNTGKIDLENYWAFSGKVSTIVIQANSITLIQNLPTRTSFPPVQQLDLMNVKSSKDSSSSNLLVTDDEQRYFEINTSSLKKSENKLYSFKFQVKGKECNCWSNSQEGYLRIDIK